jgi:hypothetical protein
MVKISLSQLPTRGRGKDKGLPLYIFLLWHITIVKLLPLLIGILGAFKMELFEIPNKKIPKSPQK